MNKLQTLYQRVPYYVLLFAVCATGIQHIMLHVDDALNLDFNIGDNIDNNDTIAGLQVLRFAVGLHVYAAGALFWVMPTCVMLMCGKNVLVCGMRCVV